VSEFGAVARPGQPANRVTDIRSVTQESRLGGTATPLWISKQSIEIVNRTLTVE